ARPSSGLDDKWLAQPLRQPLTYQARKDVDRAASREADDDAHRPARIGLRPSDARKGRQRGSTRGQIKEFATGRFHVSPSGHAIRRGRLSGSSVLLLPKVVEEQCRLLGTSRTSGDVRLCAQSGPKRTLLRLLSSLAILCTLCTRLRTSRRPSRAR